MRHLYIQVADDTCCFCDRQAVETPLHLFVDCDWIRNVREGIQQWKGITIRKGEVHQEDAIETVSKVTN